MGDLGRYPLKIMIVKRVVKYWLRFGELDDSRLVKEAFNGMMEWGLNGEVNSWLKDVKNVFDSVGMSEVFVIGPHYFESHIQKSQLLLQIERRLKDQYEQLWKVEVERKEAKNGKEKQGNKLRMYGKFKKCFGFEAYLEEVRSRRKRICLARFRMSAHSLRVESGRWDKPFTEVEQRICHLCGKGVEDEKHFLMQCSMYEVLRKEMVNKILMEKEVFKYWSEEEKFIFLMSSKNPKVLICVADFLHDAFNRRRELLSKLPWAA
jgi:hypothetical protein